MSYEKIIVIVRKTRLEELIERFNTRAQAKFYIEHAGADFSDYEKEHDTYHKALDLLQKQLAFGLKVQLVQREFVPTFLFTAEDLILAVGQDGLVANTAKYAGDQPIVGINPDAGRIDGVLVPVSVNQAAKVIQAVIEGTANIQLVTLGEVSMNDGQKLLAFNDFFLGAQSHISARYRLSFQNRSERQSSSGLIVSTGAGSTGWLSSVFNMASGLSRFMGGTEVNRMTLKLDDPSLIFAVREPFVSKHSSANIVAGIVNPSNELVIESNMPSAGTIFSDGLETDFITFNAGSIATIRPAKQKAHLVFP